MPKSGAAFSITSLPSDVANLWPKPPNLLKLLCWNYLPKLRAVGSIPITRSTIKSNTYLHHYGKKSV